MSLDWSSYQAALSAVREPRRYVFLGMTEEQLFFGPSLRFDFRVEGGQHAGRVSCMHCAPFSIKKEGIRTKILTGIMGRPVSADEAPDLTAYIGRSYAIAITGSRAGQFTIDAA